MEGNKKTIFHISKNPLEAHTIFRRVVENLCDHGISMYIDSKKKIINTKNCIIYFRTEDHRSHLHVSNIFGIDPIKAKNRYDYEDRAAALNFKGDILDCILMYEGIKR